jgi:hypothetical protein
MGTFRIGGISKVGSYPTAVSYGEYPVVDPVDQSPESMEAWRNLLWTKANFWLYKQEHRPIGNAGGKLKLKSGTINHVILGVNGTEASKNKLQEILHTKDHRPRPYQAFPAVSAFKIELEQVPY